MSGINQYTLGENDSNVGQKTDKYKGEAGRTDRLTLAWVDLDENGLPKEGASPRFVGGKRHFMSGVGYFLHNGPEFEKIAGGAPKEVVATVVVKWPSRNGELDKARLLEDWKVLGWVFSGDKYAAIRGIHKEFPMGTHDLKPTCTDSQFQKMTFAPCKDSVLAKLAGSEKGQEVAKRIYARVQEVSKDLAGMIGRDLTIQQIRQRLNGGGSSPSNGAGTGSMVSDDDIDDVLLDNLD